MTEIRSLSDLAEYAHDQIQRITEMQRDLASCSAEARSPRGHVLARTGPGGALLELRLEPDANRLPVDDLAAEVAAAVTEAQRQYAERADSVMSGVLGLRPSEQAADALEAGMSRLEALGADLARLGRSRQLSD